MKNELYRGLIERDEAGEVDTAFIVTREINGCALWYQSHESGLHCIQFDAGDVSENDAIETAVQRTFEERQKRQSRAATKAEAQS